MEIKMDMPVITKNDASILEEATDGSLSDL